MRMKLSIDFQDMPRSDNNNFSDRVFGQITIIYWIEWSNTLLAKKVVTPRDDLSFL